MASYAKASEERLNERYAEYESEYIVNNDNSNPKYPIMTAADPNDFNNLGNFEFGGSNQREPIHGRRGY